MNAKSEQKARTHAEILRSASELIRARGIAAASVANVMGRLGLTVGGFYAHFASKDALVAEALDDVMSESWQALVQRHAKKPRDQRLTAVVDGYLSAAHRDTELSGCPMPAIVSELPAQEGGVRKAFRQSFLRNVRLLRDAGEIDEEEALAAMALMVGAMVLARATRGSELSDRLLSAARRGARTLLGLEGRPLATDDRAGRRFPDRLGRRGKGGSPFKEPETVREPPNKRGPGEEGDLRVVVRA